MFCPDGYIAVSKHVTLCLKVIYRLFGMYLLAELGSPLNLESSTQPNTQGMCGRKYKALGSYIKRRKHANIPSPGHPDRTSRGSMTPKTRSILKERQRKHTIPTTGKEDCERQPKKRTVHTTRLAESQEPLRNVHKVGPILTRDAGQIRVRVTCPAGSEKAGQPPCGFVPASPAALHGVAANRPSASHRRLRPGSSAPPLLPRKRGEDPRYQGLLHTVTFREPVPANPCTSALRHYTSRKPEAPDGSLPVVGK